MDMLAVHDWNPVLLEIGGPLAIRWYGVAYLLSFVVGFYLLKRLAEKELWVLPGKEVADFITFSAIFGVFLGGRLGYILFYMLPAQGLQSILSDPLVIVRVWEGGMASHGGIFALVIFTYFYSRKKEVSWTGLGDGLCVVAPVGLFFVRMANFINGELYGRIDHGVKWAMRFPGALVDPKAPEYANYQEAAVLVQQHYPMEKGDNYSIEYLKEALRAKPELHQALEPLLMPRHPSQLYEALLEGALLFAILWGVRLKWPRLGHGVLTGMFFIIYALGRMTAESYREPDSAMIGALTKGQFYSTFMIALGIGFLIWGCTKGKRT